MSSERSGSEEDGHEEEDYQMQAKQDDGISKENALEQQSTHSQKFVAKTLVKTQEEVPEHKSGHNVFAGLLAKGKCELLF